MAGMSTSRLGDLEGHPVHGLAKAPGGDQVQVIRGIVGLEHGRHGVEALHQQAHFVIDGKVQGPHQPLAAALPQPGGRGLKQGIGYLLVLDGLKKAPKAGTRAIVFVMQPVEVSRDAPHRLAIPVGQEILGFADFKEGPPALVQESALLG